MYLKNKKYKLRVKNLQKKKKGVKKINKTQFFI
jgi:hypothetical protein